MGLPPNHPILVGFSPNKNHPFGVPPWLWTSPHHGSQDHFGPFSGGFLPSFPDLEGSWWWNWPWYSIVHPLMGYAPEDFTGFPEPKNNPIFLWHKISPPTNSKQVFGLGHGGLHAALRPIARAPSGATKRKTTGVRLRTTCFFDFCQERLGFNLTNEHF